MKTPATLPKFEFHPEHKDACRGFSVRIKGGVYHIQWRDPVTRKMKSKRGGTTHTEVMETIGQLGARTSIGKPVVSGTVPTWQVIEDWFERGVIGKKRPKTAQTYAYYVERFILPTLGGVRFSSLTEPVVSGFFERIDEFDAADPLLKKKAGVSVHQVNTVKKVVKSLFRWAHDEGYILGNPAANLRLETVEPSERSIYTPQQFEVLLNYVNPYYRPHVMTLYWSSMRVGELGALSWENIHFRSDGKVDIHIEHGLSLKEVGPPKTPKSRRLITLPGFIAVALKEHKERQARTHEPHPSNLVFTTSAGGTLDIGRFRERVVYKARERANKALAAQELEPLAKVTVHGLRHSTLTLYSDAGVNLPQAVIQRHAGHTTQRTTDLYTHLEDKRREALAEVMESVHANTTTEAQGEPDSQIA